MNERLKRISDSVREAMRTDPTVDHDGYGGPHGGIGRAFDGLQGIWQWDELASEIGQESQARVAFAGLDGAGKSLLFNRLRGWVVSRARVPDPMEGAPVVESFGMFLLADLPESPGPDRAGSELSLALGEPALVLYLLDGVAGVREADFRYIALFRAAGIPVVVALNKCDLVEDVPGQAAEARRRLGMEVLPVSALTGEGVEDVLLPALLNAAPKLAVAFGREIECLRRAASRRVIRQAALMAGLISAQPVPLLDIPFQAMLQAGVVMRVGAAYGRPASGGLNKEVLGAVIGALSLRYLVQTLLKAVPVIGWAISGVMGAASTLLIGEAAIWYYESGGKVSLPEALRKRPRFRRRLRRRALVAPPQEIPVEGDEIADKIVLEETTDV